MPRLKKMGSQLYRRFEEQMENLLSPAIPLKRIEALVRPPLILPFYHLISDERVEHVINLYSYRNTHQFRTDLDFFLSRYRALDLKDIIAHVSAQKHLHKPGFLLSFDDGLREVFDVVAPILSEKGVPAVFFLTTSFLDNKSLGYRHKASVLVENLRRNKSLAVERTVSELLRGELLEFRNVEEGILSLTYNHRDTLDTIAAVLEVDFGRYLLEKAPYVTSEQVNRLISYGFRVGAHSVDHPLYSVLTAEDQIVQTFNSMKSIKESFKLDYSVFAFPFTDYGARKSVLRELDGEIDLFFGTSAFKMDSMPKVVQRFWMENSFDSAERILNRRYVGALMGAIFGFNTTRRK